MRRCLALLPLCFLITAAAASGAPIVIGRGPEIGADRGGTTYYQELQDWIHSDLKALDPADDEYLYNDGYDASRDIVAFYERQESGNIYFRLDFLDLLSGADASNLNIYLAVQCTPDSGQVYYPDFTNCQTDHPWNLCIALYNSGSVQNQDFKLYDRNFSTSRFQGYWRGTYFNSDLDAVEFGVSRAALIECGWDGVRPLYFQALTTKDFGGTSCPSQSKIVDCLLDSNRGCPGAAFQGVIQGAVSDRDSGGGVYYASVAHGNQSINRGADTRAQVYDTQASTGIVGGTGFIRTLDTHRIFAVPINLHPSGTLTTALLWARAPSGGSDPSDGPALVDSIRAFVDTDQSRDPGALIGGVYAEHILPYFEGEVNRKSFSLTDSLNSHVYGVGAAASRVAHVPERVIHNVDGGGSPLTGHTFDDLAASGYEAVYLDELTHLHAWFYPGESRFPDQPYRHKIHRVNGVKFFCINDYEDQRKFSNTDNGADIDARRSLLAKANSGDTRQLALVFDDWEALAGKSFDPVQGHSVPNNNPIQYQRTIRWLANHPWVQVVTLASMLERAALDPAWIVEHGTRTDLSIQTYEYLKHSSEDSYNNWYYNQEAAVTGNEQSYYDLVPVITGPQGDYHSRGATPANDGPPLPSGRKLGDLDTPGSLLRDTWLNVSAAPAGALKELAWLQYQAMIYETAWHEEDQTGYSSTPYQVWNSPDGTWDGVNTWNLQLSNHAREAGILAAAARWADSVSAGLIPAASAARSVDLDEDGVNEYVLQNDKLFCVFERYGARLVCGVAYDPLTRGGIPILGSFVTNPAAPGEEEYGTSGPRCSSFKDMNGGGYVDMIYGASPLGNGFRFTSPDFLIQKDITLGAGSDTLRAAYNESVSGALYVRLGLSPNSRDLVYNGRANLVPGSDGAPVQNGTYYELANSAGGRARVLFGGAAWNPSPLGEDADRRALPLTEEVELSGNGEFSFAIVMNNGQAPVGVGPRPRAGGPAIAFGPVRPSPGSGPFHISFSAGGVPAGARITLHNVEGRIVRELGSLAEGEHDVRFEARDDAGRGLPAGIYFARAATSSESATRRFVVLR